MYQRAKYKDTSTDWTKITNPVATKKIDGAHYFLIVGPTGQLSYISRRPSIKGGYPDRSANLPHLTSKVFPHLAGEIYSVELHHTGHSKLNMESHPAVSGILNSLPARAIETQKTTGPIRAALIDVIKPELKTYADKVDHLKKFESQFGNSDILFVPPIKIGKDEINDLIESTKAEGSEGVIITSYTKPEAENYRVKIKHINTYNLKITGITREIDIQGNPKDSAGAVIVSDATGREVGNVGTGFTREQRIDIYKNPGRWKNKLIQVKALPPTAYRLRSPVFNGDADGDIDEVIPVK